MAVQRATLSSELIAAGRAHAASLLRAAANVTDDPRLSRMQLVNFANKLRDLSSRSTAVAAALDKAHAAVHVQQFTSDDWNTAAQAGPPKINQYVHGPLNFARTTIRLTAHPVLMDPTFAQRSDDRLSRPDEFASWLSNLVDKVEPNLCNSTMVQAAQKDQADAQFHQQLDLAGEDWAQLYANNEIAPFAKAKPALRPQYVTLDGLGLGAPGTRHLWRWQRPQREPDDGGGNAGSATPCTVTNDQGQTAPLDPVVCVIVIVILIVIKILSK